MPDTTKTWIESFLLSLIYAAAEEMWNTHDERIVFAVWHDMNAFLGAYEGRIGACSEVNVRIPSRAS